MKLEEYKKACRQVETTADEELASLARKYALANNDVELGDIVEDHIGFVRVQSIWATISIEGTPACVYSGPKIKRDGTSYKNGGERDVYQGNLLEQVK